MLLDHLQSDAIESRFDWLRQLSGANYFICMRQLLESDKKIRVLSLVKFSGYSLAEIDESLQSDSTPDHNAGTTSPDDNTSDSMVAKLMYGHWPSSHDANIICYVSEAIARSVVRTTRCDHCRESLISTDSLEQLELDASLDHSTSTFLDYVNGGGLSTPTEYTFTLTVNCWRVFEEVRLTAELKSMLLGATSQKSVFCKVMDSATDKQCGMPLVDDNCCFQGHYLQTFLVSRFFNCMEKNLAKDLTNIVNRHSDNPSQKRKLTKLNSKVAV